LVQFRFGSCWSFKLRGQFYEAPPSLEGETIEVRFDPLDLSQLEIYFQGEVQAMARPIDAAINAQLPSLKPVLAPPPAPTGISFVELLEQKHQQAEPEKEHDKDKETENKE